MRFALIVVMTLMAHGCSADSAQRLPTAPSSPSTTPAPNPTPAPNSTAVYGFVLSRAVFVSKARQCRSYGDRLAARASRRLRRVTLGVMGTASPLRI